MSQEYQCHHIKSGEFKASTQVIHKSLGPLTRIELDTATKLCPICSGVMVRVLELLERNADPLVTFIAAEFSR